MTVHLLLLLGKVTVILFAASTAAWLMRSATAAARHVAWATALIAVATVAALTPIAPAVIVPIHLPDHATAISQASPVPMSTDVSAFDPPSTTQPVARPQSTWSAVIQGAATHAGLILAVAWCLVVLLLLARLAIGYRTVRRMIADATLLDDDAVAAQLRTVLQSTRVSRPVALLLSDDIAAPVTAGWQRPVILLPFDCTEWSDERWRVVFTHECAHIARHDYLSQLFASVLSALLWFHPAIWYAAARLRVEGEQAADDCVLASGVTGVSYAEHLLAIARHEGEMFTTPYAVVAMARTSHLESRLRAMFDSTRPHQGSSPRRRLFAVSLAMLALIPLAGIRTEVRAATVPLQAIASAPTAVATMVATAVPDFAPAMSDSTFERTLSARSGGTITIDLRTGGDLVLHAGDNRSIRMRARLGGENGRDTRVTLDDERGGARLEASFDRNLRNSSTSNAFELWLPKQFNVRVTSSGGPITISDLDGAFTGNTGGGNIRIDHTSGTVALVTGGGDISVRDSHLEGTLRTGGGHVAVQGNDGDLHASSGSEVALGAAMGAELAARNAERAAVMNGRLMQNTMRMQMTADSAERSAVMSDRIMQNGVRQRVMADSMEARAVARAVGRAQMSDELRNSLPLARAMGDQMGRSTGDARAQLDSAEAQLREVARLSRASGATAMQLRQLDAAMQRLDEARNAMDRSPMPIMPAMPRRSYPMRVDSMSVREDSIASTIRDRVQAITERTARATARAYSADDEATAPPARRAYASTGETPAPSRLYRGNEDVAPMAGSRIRTASPAEAGRLVVIVGKVTGSDGRAISGAAIRTSSEGILHNTVSDRDGNYRLVFQSPRDTFSVRVTPPVGTRDVSFWTHQVVRAPDDDRIQLNVHLYPRMAQVDTIP